MMHIVDYLPRVDYTVATLAMVSGLGLGGAWVYKFAVKPGQVLEEWGIKGAEAQSSWVVLVNIMRFCAMSVSIQLFITLYLFYSVSLPASIWFLFWTMFAFTMLHGFRAFGEKKSADVNDAEVANAKKHFMIFGSVTTLLFAAGCVMAMEMYNGYEFVNDSKKGLPEELSYFTEAAKSRFLSFKQHVMTV